jgi:uncharacterized protein GlcG (DUF336 family)
MNAISKLTVSAAAAQRIIEAGVAEAQRLGLSASIAVVDESGVLRAFHRMDGAALVTVSSSQDKAFTAVGFGIPSHAWFPMIKDDPALLHGVPTAIERVVIFGGGIPITVDGELVGGVGVGGGTHEQDRQIAEASVAALEPAG